MLNQLQKGFSITEILIGLVMGLILTLGSVYLMMSNMRYSTLSLKTMRLNHDLETTMNIIVEDIRRAGYWANAASDLYSGTNTNPFMVAGTDISISNDNCILLTYDKDKNGSLASIGAASGDERYGYRLQGTAIQARTNGAAYDCTAAADAWVNMTDPKVTNITNFSVSQTNKSVDVDGAGPGTSAMVVRTITVNIPAQLTDDANVTKTLSQTVKVRNDKYVP